MDSQEATETIPNIKICLDDLRIFNDSTAPVTKKVNVMRVKHDNLKAKSNFDKLKDLQQSPKISRISQLLTSPSSTKSSYVSTIKQQSMSLKGIPRAKPTKIDYSKCTSLAQFAISKTQSLLKKPELEPVEVEESEAKDMYAKGQAYMKKKKENLEKRTKVMLEESMKICTFVPEIKVQVGNRKRKEGKVEKNDKYKPLSPYVGEVAYRAGCDLESLKEKCSVMESYLTVKMPNS